MRISIVRPRHAAARLLCVALMTSACAHLRFAASSAPAPGSRYVSLGSSYAAGPGITQNANDPGAACSHSIDNYAHQLARKRSYVLVDASCSGAVTAGVLKASSAGPAQLDSITPDTALVTVTIGGNDVYFTQDLGAASCRFLATATCQAAPWPTDADFAKARDGLTEIAAQVRLRAPHARLIFIDYPQVLPAGPPCAATPMTQADLDHIRGDAARLAQITAQVAGLAKAGLVQASELSRGHDACAADAWMNGDRLPGGPAITSYHPKLASMTAIAQAIDQMLGR